MTSSNNNNSKATGNQTYKRRADDPRVAMPDMYAIPCSHRHRSDQTDTNTGPRLQPPATRPLRLATTLRPPHKTRRLSMAMSPSTATASPPSTATASPPSTATSSLVSLAPSNSAVRLAPSNHVRKTHTTTSSCRTASQRTLLPSLCQVPAMASLSPSRSRSRQSALVQMARVARSLVSSPPTPTSLADAT